MLEKVGDGASSSPLEEAVVVHMHLGMSGSFRTYKFPGTIPALSARCFMHRFPGALTCICSLANGDFSSELHELCDILV